MYYKIPHDCFQMNVLFVFFLMICLCNALQHSTQQTMDMEKIRLKQKKQEIMYMKKMLLQKKLSHQKVFKKGRQKLI